MIENQFLIKLRLILKFLAKIVVFTVLVIVLAFALRVFLFSTFVIPSPSMEPALTSGDKIIVNKLIPGPRIFKNLGFIDGTIKPRLNRLRGVRQVKRNDVLVFNYPYNGGSSMAINMSVHYVKRCMALPGDTFYIENGFYHVKGCSDTLGNFQNQMKLSLSSKDNYILNGVYTCFPYHEKFNWNVDSFGPLYVPQKGVRMQLDSMNIVLYHKIIEYETEKSVSVKSDKIYLNDSLITSYCFLSNYYFMAGDYVQDSQDSRYWGLLPEDNIVGKVAVIWKSQNPHTGKIRWDRVMKRVK
jgi:signal peptidase I